MKGYFNSPKRIIILILFIAMCVVAAIGGAMMALSMNGAVQ